MRNPAMISAVTVLVTVLTTPVNAPCSSFCLNADGVSIVGANFDRCKHQDGLVIVNKRGMQKRGFSPGTTGEYVSWTSKYGSVTFSTACRELVHYGMNETGLVVTATHLSGSRGPAADERPPLDGDYWAQYLLDNFSTVQEVVASDSTVRMVNDRDHYLICDRDGRCLIVECLEGKVHYLKGESTPVQAISGAPYADCLAHWERGVIPDPDPGASFERFLSASQWIEDFEVGRKSGADYAFDILDHTSQGGCTQWRIVFDTQSLRFYFRTKKVKAIRYCDLNKLDFDCSTPMKMLDINEKLRGDVSAEFVDYSQETSLTYAEKELSTSGVDKTLEETKELLEFFESFKCAGSGN